MKSFINQIQPWIGEEEAEQLLRVTDSTFVTEHKLTKEFEDAINDTLALIQQSSLADIESGGETK